jgi:hypothetical protein
VKSRPRANRLQHCLGTRFALGADGFHRPFEALCADRGQRSTELGGIYHSSCFSFSAGPVF